MYRASDGYPLHFRRWAPLGPPRATLIALHGIQSHGGWYGYSSRKLAEAGYEVFFLDRRGSGLNARERGHALHGDRLLADVRQFLRQRAWACRHEPPRPVILMGVSWGGKLATACAATFPEEFAGVALLYPGLYSQLRPSLWQTLQLELASAVGWGHVSAPIPLNDPELFTSTPIWQEYIRRDELALQRVSVDFLRANLWLSRYIEQRAAHIRGPLLMMLAGRDQIIDNAANRAFLNRLRGVSTQVVDYPDACHTLEFEPSPDRFIYDLQQWLDTTVSQHRLSEP